MAALEVIALDTSVPQLMAPQAGDTYTFPRAVEMPLGTANGVLYLNGSKVVTSGSGLTFDGANFATTGRGTFGQRIQVTGNTAPSTGAGLELFYDGTVAAALAFARGTGYLPLGLDGSDIRFYASSSEQMRLTSTGLGIGTSSPATKLHVAGTGAFGATGTDGGISIRRGADGVQVGSISLDNTNAWLKLSTGYGTLILNANGIDRLTIDSSGNLGLGVTPSAWGTNFRAQNFGSTGVLYARNGGVELSGIGSNAYSNNTNFLYIQSSPASLYQQTAGVHQFFTSTDPTPTAGNPISFSQVMTLDASGNLGVGVTSIPLYANYKNIAVGGVVGGAIDFIASNIGVGNNRAAQIFTASGALAFATGASDTMLERARITSVGNFKIGGSADRATTEGTNQLVLFDGTAPVGTLANGVSFYSASGEANVMDAAGNATLLSPHDAETNEWIFRSKHTPTGKVLKIDVERLLKFVNDHFGLDAVHEFVEV